MDETLDPLLRELIGGVLCDERRRQARTLADVARQAGVSMQHLSYVERGRKDPSSEVLAAITGALRLPVCELLRRGADAPAGPRVLDFTTRRERSRLARPDGDGAAGLSGSLCAAA